MMIKMERLRNQKKTLSQQCNKIKYQTNIQRVKQLKKIKNKNKSQSIINKRVMLTQAVMKIPKKKT